MVKLTDKFPVETRALIDGVDARERQRRALRRHVRPELRPLVQLGVRPAGREGRRRRSWSRPPSASAGTRSRRSRATKPSTLPDAGAIVSPLEIGSTAIGQCKVLATPLQMASSPRPSRTTASACDRRWRPTREPKPEAGDLAEGRLDDRGADDRRGRIRHRHRRGDPRREGGGQDRHGRARGHPRAGDGAADPSVEHRRLVHLVRPGGHPRSPWRRCSCATARAAARGAGRPRVVLTRRLKRP